MAADDISPELTKRAQDRFESVARSLFRQRGFADPGGDKIGQIVHGAMAGASAEELRSPDSIGTATLGRLDQLVSSAVEADRPRNIHSAEAARLAQLGTQAAAGVLGHKAYAELQRARLDGREPREGGDRGDGRSGGGARAGERYASLPVAGDGVSSAAMGAYVQQYAGTGLGRGSVQTFAEIGLQRGAYEAYRREGFSQQDIDHAAKTTKNLGWKQDPQAFDDIQRSTKPERAALVQIHREQDPEKQKALIDRKRKELDIDHKPQDAQDRWNRNIDRIQGKRLDAAHEHGGVAASNQSDSKLLAERAQEPGKAAAAKVTLANLATNAAKEGKASAKGADSDFGVAAAPTKPADGKPASANPKVG